MCAACRGNEPSATAPDRAQHAKPDRSVWRHGRAVTRPVAALAERIDQAARPLLAVFD